MSAARKHQRELDRIARQAGSQDVHTITVVSTGEKIRFCMPRFYRRRR